MKLLHIADLHIGRRVNGMSMIAEQANAIDQIIDIARDEGVSAVLVAGDVFDRPMPSREALELCERLFSGLCDLGIPVFVVPGNHDSPQQLAFCSMLLAPAGLHIAKAFDGHIERFLLEEDGLRVWVHLLPFVRPTDVRMSMPGQADSISSHDDAVRCALLVDDTGDDGYHVLVAHQFVTNAGQAPDTCDSEVLSIGGTDNVDASAFDAYEYVALGHLHGPQAISRPGIRYAGSPLKYSFSEVNHHKSATLVTIDEDGVSIDMRPIVAMHDMRVLEASFEELEAGIDGLDHDDYMRITLTNRSLPDAMAKVRALYPNILRLDFAQSQGDAQAPSSNIERIETTSTLELFEEYYERQVGEGLDEESLDVITSCIEEARR